MRFICSLMVLLLAPGVGGCTPARGAPPSSVAPGSWQRIVVVELFTSQGCSSCPAADALVRDLSRLGLGRDKVLPLSFHVDYWDGLGWKDPFASVAFTQRQDWYARAGRLRDPNGQPGLRGLYTPQMIVDGTVHFSGQRRQSALAEIQRAGARPPLADMTAEAAINSGTVRINVAVTPRPALDPTQDWRLAVALTAKKTRTRVLHGENGGETLDEAAVVRALSPPIALLFPTRKPESVTLTKPSDLDWSEVQLTAFIQSERTGQIAGALDIHAR